MPMTRAQIAFSSEVSTKLDSVTANLERSAQTTSIAFSRWPFSNLSMTAVIGARVARMPSRFSSICDSTYASMVL